MPHTDLPLDELRSYRPEVAEPADFDEFWASTLTESRAVGGSPEWTPASSRVTAFAIDDLVFPGFAGEPVRAWITRPVGAGDAPVVVEYIGYGGGRGLPGERLHWAAAGYAHVLMDTRGQGSSWGTGGATPDPHGSDPSFPGWMTRGIENPRDHFYRRVFTDAVRLLDAVADIPGLDASRVAVTGTSQGGGIALAAAGLSDRVRAVLPDVPFLCHFRRSVALTPKPPFSEIAGYLAIHRDREDAVFTTLSYLDGVNFARRIHAPALFSVGLMDDVVLPSSVFAAYHHLAGDDTEIAVYPYNGHEGGGLRHWERQVDWLGARL